MFYFCFYIHIFFNLFESIFVYKCLTITDLPGLELDAFICRRICTLGLALFSHGRFIRSCKLYKQIEKSFNSYLTCMGWFQWQFLCVFYSGQWCQGYPTRCYSCPPVALGKELLETILLAVYILQKVQVFSTVGILQASIHEINVEPIPYKGCIVTIYLQAKFWSNVMNISCLPPGFHHFGYL